MSMMMVSSFACPEQSGEQRSKNTAVRGRGAVKRPERALDVLRAALRLITADRRDSIAREIGMSERKLRAIKDAEQRPCLDEGLAIAAKLGPETVNAMLAPYGLGGAQRIEIAPALEDVAATAGRLAMEAIAALSPNSEAGRSVSHGEARRLLDHGEQLEATIAGLNRELRLRLGS